MHKMHAIKYHVDEIKAKGNDAETFKKYFNN